MNLICHVIHLDLNTLGVSHIWSLFVRIFPNQNSFIIHWWHIKEGWVNTWKALKKLWTVEQCWHSWCHCDISLFLQGVWYGSPQKVINEIICRGNLYRWIEQFLIGCQWQVGSHKAVCLVPSDFWSLSTICQMQSTVVSSYLLMMQKCMPESTVL